MRITILAAAALMCSASALAQTTEPTTTSDPSATPEASATTGSSATITTADPATSTSTSTSTSTASGGTAAAPATSASTSVQTSTGGVDIAAHDADRDGSLSPLEFAEHVSAATGDASLTAEARRERFSRASGNGAIKLLNRTAGEFGAADRNRDRRVDTAELAMWQSGGMSASASPVPGGTPSAPVTSGAGTTAPVPDTGATMSPSTTTDTPGDPATPETPQMTDDLQNSTDPNESTTAPPPTE